MELVVNCDDSAHLTIGLVIASKYDKSDPRSVRVYCEPRLTRLVANNVRGIRNQIDEVIEEHSLPQGKYSTGFDTNGHYVSYFPKNVQ